MPFSVKQFWNEYGALGLVFLVAILFVLYSLVSFLNQSGGGKMGMSAQTNPAYKNQPQPQSFAVQPSNPMGQNEVYSSVDASMSSSGQGIPSSCNKPNIQNPADLLPKDSNSQWAQLNPSGKGELANINLLKAGYHIGIDSIGSSLRNANQQERSDPPIPQLNTGPWNQSTITPDFIRPPLEIGQGGQ
jgi:hypothetical protein